MSVDVLNLSVKVESVANTESKAKSNAEYVKQIRRKHLQREVYADPSMAKELVKIKASPVYNASGELIQAVDVSKK